MNEVSRSKDELATRRLIIWSAKLVDLWAPVDIADFMLAPQSAFGGQRPVDMMSNQSTFEDFDGRMRQLLDGTHT